MLEQIRVSQGDGAITATAVFVTGLEVEGIGDTLSESLIDLADQLEGR